MSLRAVVSQRLIKSLDNSRVAAVEVLLDSPRIKDLILKGQISELKESMEKSTLQGMQSFDQALYDLYKDGKISLDEAIKNADSANNVRLRVKLSEDSSSSGQVTDSKKFDQVISDSDNKIKEAQDELEIELE
jgi:twitching motility protein PilU